MIDDKMHNTTLYQIPRLTDLITREHEELKKYYDSDYDVEGWDGYNGIPIKRDTADSARIVLNKIHVFFLENLGFLNNRGFEIETSPLSSGEISIEIDYAGELLCCFSVKNNDSIRCHARLKYFFVFDGQTVAERNSKMFHSKDKLVKEVDINNIKTFLDEAFYQHQWRTYEN